MGNKNTKSSLRNAIIYLNISADPVRAHDDKFWAQIWSEEMSSAAEIIKSISIQEIRMLRDGSPKNFATLTYKMVERLCLATGTLCNTLSQQTAVLNATRILIRLIPCIYEDKLWQNFFIDNEIYSATSGLREELELIYPKKEENERNYKSYLPPEIRAKAIAIGINDNSPSTSQSQKCDYSGHRASPTTNDQENLYNFDNFRGEVRTKSLLRSLILSLCDLLFCPEFTVSPHTDSYFSRTVDAPPEDLKSLATCEYVWEPGVGFDSDVNSTTCYDKSRLELVRLLLTCFSVTLYETPDNSLEFRNHWIEIFASNDNRHVLPLFTSLLNTVFIYKPSKLLPFNHLLFEDAREELVEISLQTLVAVLDCQFQSGSNDEKCSNNDKRNLFIEYMSRIHRNEDFTFLIKGFKRLLNNRLEQGYLLNPTKHINFDQELLILFWKLCNLNKKFLSYLLKTKDILDISIPILYHLNENFQDSTKTALIHIGVFNLLILSGERNFGVRLNKPYSANVLMNLPAFTGSHGDLMIIIAHKLILYGQNLNQLFDFLLTIVVNISPYLKALSMLASKCLIQLFEIFSSPFVIFTEPNYHQLVIFLLEIFNNLVQYQFDGNANLVYAITSKKELFINLANLPITSNGIEKILNKLIKKKQRHKLIERLLNEPSWPNTEEEEDEEGSSKSTNRGNDSSQRFEATVSNRSPSTSNSNGLEQEVSLVATPDICSITQPIHPFVSDSVSPDLYPTTSCSKPSIDLDDLLNQSNEASQMVESCLDNDLNGIGSISLNQKPEVDNHKQTNGSQCIADGTRIKETKIEREFRAINNQKWKPSPEWVRQWKHSLPLHTTLRMIEVLTPQIERFKHDNVGHHDEIEIIKFLQNGTLVGLLPVPHPIVIRKYHTNNETILWFRACTWGIIYVRNSMWIDTAVKLIKVI